MQPRFQVQPLTCVRTPDRISNHLGPELSKARPLHPFRGPSRLRIRRERRRAAEAVLPYGINRIAFVGHQRGYGWRRTSFLFGLAFARSGISEQSRGPTPIDSVCSRRRSLRKRHERLFNDAAAGCKKGLAGEDACQRFRTICRIEAASSDSRQRLHKGEVGLLSNGYGREGHPCVPHLASDTEEIAGVAFAIREHYHVF